MRVRQLAITIVLFFLCSSAIAESYQIRVTLPVRLRESYNLRSRIVERTLAGEALQVVDRHNRWLKIDRNGKTVWLADWVDYTRLDGQGATPLVESEAAEESSSSIDNCCYVDRQCSADHEWVNGYWAYLRNECSVSTQSQQQTPVSQPQTVQITEAPHRVTNSQGREIPIYGDVEFRLSIAKAFYYLRDNVPQWWTYVSIIDDFKLINGACIGEYACADWPYKGLLFGHHVYGVDVRGLASTLIHEACHIYQFQEGRGHNYDWLLAWEDRPHEIECQNKKREAGF